MSKMSEQDILKRSFTCPYMTNQCLPTRDDLEQVVRVVEPEPDPDPHDEQPYADEFCPNCGSENWESFPGEDSECYNCGELFQGEDE
jgi:hypothetical protein